jgi:hypothetical protein
MALNGTHHMETLQRDGCQRYRPGAKCPIAVLLGRCTTAKLVLCVRSENGDQLGSASSGRSKMKTRTRTSSVHGSVCYAVI